MVSCRKSSDTGATGCLLAGLMHSRAVKPETHSDPLSVGSFTYLLKCIIEVCFEVSSHDFGDGGGEGDRSGDVLVAPLSQL